MIRKFRVGEVVWECELMGREDCYYCGCIPTHESVSPGLSGQVLLADCTSEYRAWADCEAFMAAMGGARLDSEETE